MAVFACGGFHGHEVGFAAVLDFVVVLFGLGAGFVAVGGGVGDEAAGEEGDYQLDGGVGERGGRTML